MRRFGLVLAITLFLPSCVRVEYREYRGPQDWPTGASFVGRVEGVEVYEGLPQRPYQVVGLVDVYSDEPFESGSAKKEVLDLVDTKDAHALIWLNDFVVASGSLHMENAIKGPVSIESGRAGRTVGASEPGGRSTLLLIQWKSN
jgi:hypothetical protein